MLREYHSHLLATKYGRGSKTIMMMLTCLVFVLCFVDGVSQASPRALARLNAATANKDNVFVTFLDEEETRAKHQNRTENQILSHDNRHIRDDDGIHEDNNIYQDNSKDLPKQNAPVSTNAPSSAQPISKDYFESTMIGVLFTVLVVLVGIIIVGVIAIRTYKKTLAFVKMPADETEDPDVESGKIIPLQNMFPKKKGGNAASSPNRFGKILCFQKRKKNKQTKKDLVELSQREAVILSIFSDFCFCYE